MTRTLEQTIDDWFRNSPDWPMEAGAIKIEAEVAAFMSDDQPHAAEDVRRAMTAFVASLPTE